MKQADVGASIQRMSDACRTLLRAELDFCKQVVDTIGKAAPQRSSCDCTIPPPCWMPRDLGTYASEVCAGGSATVKLTITNCDRVKRTYTVSAAGEGAGRVRITPTSLSLGPMESGCVTVVFQAPDDARECRCIETLIWVLGCNEHFLRWHVTVGHGSKNACIDAAVEDCPDYIHHWYDHFYCVRPCFGRRKGTLVGKGDD